MSDTQHIIEPFVPFSQSILWDLQRNFFNSEGIQAWNQQVPYYVTSNMLIAHHYAETLASFIQDIAATRTIDPANPVYIFELGSGTGKFSFYMMKQLATILDSLQLRHCAKYIITDISEQNLNYWKSHSQFKPYFESGFLDIGLIDIENPPDVIQLHYSGSLLNASSFEQPICLIGNYVLDGVKNDCFRIENNQINELQIKTTATAPSDNGHLPPMNDCSFEFEAFATTNDYYQNPIFDSILNDYIGSISNSSLLFPSSALKFLEHFLSLSNQQLLFLSGDKGHQTLSDLDHLSKPHISSHGSVSLMANFHAISRFFELKNGIHMHSPLTHSFKVNLFYIGDPLINQTKRMFNTVFSGVNPGNYLALKNDVIQQKDKLSLDSLFGLIETSFFDPDIYFDLYESITQALPKGSNRDIQNLTILLDHVKNNYYYLPFGNNILFGLANNYYMLSDYLTALDLYKRSLIDFEVDYSVLFNIGLCLFYCNEFNEALDFFKRAKVESDTDDVNQWIQKTSDELP